MREYMLASMIGMMTKNGHFQFNSCFRMIASVRSTDALAIQAEILVAAVGDEGFGNSRKHGAKPCRIILEAVAKPLIGKIDKGNEPPVCEKCCQPYR